MTPDDVARFRKILGLLGSDQVGERAAAALKATEFLATHGLTWSDVTLPVREPVVDARRAVEETLRNAKAARKAAWAQARYGADEDGFEAGRK